jgi:hypothetical protein
MQYDEYTKSLDSIKNTQNKITLNTKYKINTQIEQTPKEILEFVLNFELDNMT